MNDPTLREAAQAFEAWLTAQSQTVTAQLQTVKAWFSSLGDIHVSTIMAVVGIGVLVVFVGLLLAWLADFTRVAWRYHAIGHVWLRALRLALADIEQWDTERERKKNPY
jgi:hypothetical protein